MYIILVYDIKMDIAGPKVLRKTFKTCKRYLTHIQNSVFEGHITQAQKYELQKELEKLVRKDKDSLIVFTAPYEKYSRENFGAWKMIRCQIYYSLSMCGVQKIPVDRQTIKTLAIRGFN